MDTRPHRDGPHGIGILSLGRPHRGATGRPGWVSCLTPANYEVFRIDF
jgi:hypothetical protein